MCVCGCMAVLVCPTCVESSQLHGAAKNGERSQVVVVAAMQAPLSDAGSIQLRVFRNWYPELHNCRPLRMF